MRTHHMLIKLRPYPVIWYVIGRQEDVCVMYLASVYMCIIHYIINRLYTVYNRLCIINRLVKERWHEFRNNSIPKDKHRHI